MIKKLNNGNTLITLGEGTVYTGNVSASNEEKPFGIYNTLIRQQLYKIIII